MSEQPAMCQALDWADSGWLRRPANQALALFPKEFAMLCAETGQDSAADSATYNGHSYAPDERAVFHIRACFLDSAKHPAIYAPPYFFERQARGQGAQ